MMTNVNAAGIRIGDTITQDNYSKWVDARVVGFKKYGGLIRVYARQGRFEIPRMFTYRLGEGLTIRRDA